MAATALRRLAFDGRALASPAGGVRRYTYELFAALTSVVPDVKVIALGAPVHVELPPGVTRGPAAPAPPTNFGATVIGLPIAAWRAGADLFHATSYTAPPWGVHPLVLTIHDASYARRPEWYPYKQDAVRRWFYRRSALAADAILTDSSFSRDEIQAAYGIDGARIHVIPLGVGRPFIDQRAGPRTAAGDYVLHVGDLHPRRDLGVALDAVLEIRRRHPRYARLQLVLAGVDRGVGASLRAQASSAGAGDAIDFVRQIDDDGLLALYSHARALIYPSRYEGFGLPVVEAMACGTPVVAARAGSIPEVAGDAAVLVEPGDVRAFAEALERILVDDTFARSLADAGRARARTFTWTQTARMTLDAYRDALQRVRR